MKDPAELTALHQRFLAEGPAPGSRYDGDLFEAFLEREGVSPGDWDEAAWMGLYMGLGHSREEARELVEQLGEWGPRAAG